LEKTLDFTGFSYHLANLLPANEMKKQEMLSSKTTLQRLELQTLLLKSFLENTPEQQKV